MDKSRHVLFSKVNTTRRASHAGFESEPLLGIDLEALRRRQSLPVGTI